MKKSELKQLIREVIQEMYTNNPEVDNHIATIETSKGSYNLWWEEDREEDNVKTEYYVKGPDGKIHWVTIPGVNPYDRLNKKNMEDIKNWIEGGMKRVNPFTGK
jgi:hypothetical protein